MCRDCGVINSLDVGVSSVKDTLSQPEPIADGVYIGMDFERYKQLPAVNQSLLKLCCEVSPLHADALRKGVMKYDTPTLMLGRAEHAYIIEGPEEFAKRHPIAQQCNAKIQTGSNKGKRCTKTGTHRVNEIWFCGQHKGELATEVPEAISQFDFMRIGMMGESVRNHEINVHLARKGWSEVTIVYTVDIECRVRRCPHCEAFDYPKPFARLNELDRKCLNCGETFTVTAPEVATLPVQHKVRIDRLGRPNERMPNYVCCDLKRMQLMKGDRESRERSIRDYGYDVQGAMYTEAVRVAFERGLPVFNERGYEVDTFAEPLDDVVPFLWIFVEEKPPHDVTWFPMDADTRLIGESKLRRYRQQWATCCITNQWPGRCVGVQEPGGLPPYEKRKYERDYADDNGVLL